MSGRVAGSPAVAQGVKRANIGGTPTYTKFAKM